mmetsp:Transcript_63810/g.132213  ORF Transcript_63810/g.132213 Transcript_63810/m.132213 type:complete len:237 (-) Transcript_63810:16-726(-)
MWWTLALLFAVPRVAEAGLKAAPIGATVKEFLASASFQQAAASGNFKNLVRESLESLAPPRLTPREQAGVLHLLGQHQHLRFRGAGQRRLSGANVTNLTKQSVTYQFHSFDKDKHEGTGFLGSDGVNDSVSEVTVVHGPSGISFTIGPPIAGHFLIGGTLEIHQQRGSHHLSGKIRAAFVNLRTTLTGTWESVNMDLNSELHIHLVEVGLKEDWTWKPEKPANSSAAVNVTTKNGN